MTVCVLICLMSVFFHRVFKIHEIFKAPIIFVPHGKLIPPSQYLSVMNANSAVMNCWKLLIFPRKLFSNSEDIGVFTHPWILLAQCSCNWLSTNWSEKGIQSCSVWCVQEGKFIHLSLMERNNKSINLQHFNLSLYSNLLSIYQMLSFQLWMNYKLTTHLNLNWITWRLVGKLQRLLYGIKIEHKLENAWILDEEDYSEKKCFSFFSFHENLYKIFFGFNLSK